MLMDLVDAIMLLCLISHVTFKKQWYYFVWQIKLINYLISLFLDTTMLAIYWLLAIQKHK